MYLGIVRVVDQMWQCQEVRPMYGNKQMHSVKLVKRAFPPKMANTKFIPLHSNISLYIYKMYTPINAVLVINVTYNRLTQTS